MSGFGVTLSLRGDSMASAVRKPVAMMFMIASVFAFLMAASAPARAAGSGAFFDDDPDDDDTPLAVGDFNRDGIVDIAEVTLPGGGRSTKAFLTVLLGQKDGSFKQLASSSDLGSDPRTIVVGDFNGDGIADIIVGDEDGSLVELLGDGTGNMVSSGDVGHVSSVVSVAVGDFNHDGKLDMAVSDPKTNSVSILLGAGDGTFRPVWSFSLPMAGKVFHLAAADFNKDGIPDLAVTYDEPDEFEVMLGNGNGTFSYSSALSKTRDPNSHCAT
jgi:hypothetical protein